MTPVHQWAVGYGIQFGPNVPPHQKGGGKDWACDERRRDVAEQILTLRVSPVRGL